MTFVSESIDIDVPVDVLFSLYAEPESLPSVLSIVKHVEVLGPDLIRWDVELVGQRRSIDAKVVANEPGNRLRWESVEGRAQFAAEVRTESISPTSTRVTVDAEFDAGGIAERLGLAKPIAAAAIANELRNAKKAAEAQAAN